MGKNTKPAYAFEDFTIPELKTVLASGADIITAIRFTGNPGNIPVFHIFDVRLVLHPVQPWIGHLNGKTIVWFEISKIRDTRSALLLAKRHKRNGFTELTRMRSASEI